MGVRSEMEPPKMVSMVEALDEVIGLARGQKECESNSLGTAKDIVEEAFRVIFIRLSRIHSPLGQSS